MRGRAVGGRLGSDKVYTLTSLDDMASFNKGDVLVADMTDPDWEPVMSKAQPRRLHLSRSHYSS